MVNSIVEASLLLLLRRRMPLCSTVFATVPGCYAHLVFQRSSCCLEGMDAIVCSGANGGCPSTLRRGQTLDRATHDLVLLPVRRYSPDSRMARARVVVWGAFEEVDLPAKASSREAVSEPAGLLVAKGLLKPAIELSKR